MLNGTVACSASIGYAYHTGLTMVGHNIREASQFLKELCSLRGFFSAPRPVHSLCTLNMVVICLRGRYDKMRLFCDVRMLAFLIWNGRELPKEATRPVLFGTAVL